MLHVPTGYLLWHFVSGERVECRPYENFPDVLYDAMEITHEGLSPDEKILITPEWVNNG